MNINYQSDFKIVERLMPDAPFRFTYYIGKDRGSVTAEYDGQSYSGCFVDGDRLIVPVDGGTLGIGSVRVKREYFLDDKAFADGVCNLVSVEGTDIELGRGRTDSDIEADVEVGVYYKAFTFDDMTEEQKQEIADRVPTKEAEREKAETQRVEAESARVEAEKKRAAAEAARQATFSTNEKARQTTFSTNEKARQTTFSTNEEARQSVFNANEEKREEADAKREERTDEAIASIANKVDRTDNAPELTSGFAGNLVGRGESTEELIGFRPSGGLTSVDDGAAHIERLKGNTVVWNQYIKTINSTNFKIYSSTVGSINFTDNSAKITVLSDITNYFSCSLYSNYIIGVIANHKYATFVTAKADKSGRLLHSFNNYVHFNINTQWTTVGFIVDRSSSTTEHFYIGVSNDFSVGSVIELKDLQLIDLTQMFGAGNEPTTIEEFNARKPLNIDEYAYNEGELISTTADEIKSVGFNAWDGQLRAGYLNGEAFTIGDGSSSHTSNFVKVIPGATYYKNKSNANQTSFYDRNKSFLVGKWLNKGEFTIPNDCHFIKVDFLTADADSFCINLSHTGYRNGEYEPYEDFRRSLPISEIKDSEGNALFPNGLLSAGSVYDEITATKAIKRIGVVDMGRLGWNLDSRFTYTQFYANLEDKNSGYNIISDKYAVVTTGWSAANDKTISGVGGTTNNRYIIISDTSYTDAATFKTAMQGVMLYYELAEPIEVDLPEPINMDYEVSDFGTEEVISDTTTTPLKADIIYQFNAVDRIRENSLFLEDLIKRVAALEAQNAALVQQLNATGNGETE